MLPWVSCLLAQICSLAIVSCERICADYFNLTRRNRFCKLEIYEVSSHVRWTSRNLRCLGAALVYKRSVSSFVSPVASIMVSIGTPSFLNDFAVSSFPSSFPLSKAVSMTPFKSRYIFKLFS